MAKACPTCKGRGRWLEVDQVADEGQTEIMAWHECNDCHGTGVRPEYDDTAHDIGGSSYDDDN